MKVVIRCTAILVVLLTLPTSALYSSRSAPLIGLGREYGSIRGPLSTGIGHQSHYGGNSFVDGHHIHKHGYGHQVSSTYGSGLRKSKSFVPAGKVGFNSYMLEKLKTRGAAFLDYKQRKTGALHRYKELLGEKLLRGQFGSFSSPFPLAALAAAGYDHPLGAQQLGYLSGQIAHPTALLASSVSSLPSLF